MRTPAIVASLLLSLACSVAAGGCQVIAGLTVLEITSGAGGSGGQGGAGGQGGGGGASCVPCANGKSCNDSGECQSGYCAKSGNAAAPGICKATKKPGLECTTDDECGSGYCTDGVCCNVAKCGDECLSCAVSTDGTCAAKVGATCGVGCGDGAVVAGKCDSQGMCGALATTTTCSSTYGCNPTTTACNTMCSSSSDCSSTGFCVVPSKMCAACGVYPPMSTACTPGVGSCETCEPSGKKACVETCDSVDECTSTKVLDASKSAVKLVCNDQCNGITVNCQGPYPCEVVCDSNGCAGLVLNCHADGPCKLTCTGTGCANAQMKCGDNECVASCPVGTATKVDQICAGSCGCSKGECQ